VTRFMRFALILLPAAIVTWQIIVRTHLFRFDLLSFMSGFFTAMITGLMLFILEDWLSTATKPGRPQSITLKTTETPRQVTLAAIVAVVKLTIVACVIVAALYMFFREGIAWP